MVYHVAGRVSLDSSDAAELHRVNVDGVRSVLIAAAGAGVRRVVHVGSIEAFRLDDDHYPVTEDHAIDPDHTIMEYGRSKALGIRVALEAAADGLDVVVCCLTAIVGPPDYRVSAIGRFFRDYLRGRLPASIDGGFDFVDVRDVAAGLIAAADRTTRFTAASLKLLSLGVRVDSARARTELGYTTRPIRETVTDTVAWFRGYRG